MVEDALSVDREISRRLRVSWPVFFQQWGRLTPIQRKAIDPILLGRDVLVSASTASGKTEAVCAPLIERLMRANRPWTILYVSPTRALVNDLYSRLEEPLHRLDITLQRRTGEYKEAYVGDRVVLITTPESLDSMLCRGRTGGDGHIMQYVRAVILDEIHLMEGTARGEQLRFLLRRLKRLQKGMQARGVLDVFDHQIVALSATLPDSQRVMQDFLGEDPVFIHVAGGRDIEAVTASEIDNYTIESQLPTYVATLSESEKILVFADSRRRVDELSARLRNSLSNAGYQVRAHHGSLSKNERESVEEEIHKLSRIVVVATSTLEIGIDIGDIDLVVLDGPPKSLSSMLQRVGRGNRRTNKTRVMMCASDEAQSLINRAMLKSARDGYLGPAEHSANSAVARQQLASYIFQAPVTWRSRSILIDLIGDKIGSTLASSLIDKMLRAEELLAGPDGRISLGQYWAEKMYNGQIHSNIEGSPGAVIVDESSGRVIASGVKFSGDDRLSIGGRGYNVAGIDGYTIRVKRGENSGSAVSYLSGRYRYGSNWGAALRRYLGLSDHVWPIIAMDGKCYVLHFGGVATKWALELSSRSCGEGSIEKITNLCVVFNKSWKGMKPNWLERPAGNLDELISDDVNTLENSLGLPLANKKLPEEVRLFDIKGALSLSSELEALVSSKWLYQQYLLETSGLRELLLSDVGGKLR